MSNIVFETSYVLNISVLSHPDEIVTHLIQNFIQILPRKAKCQKTEDKYISITSFKYEIDQKWLMINLVQPSSRHLIDKMSKHHYTTIDGALILFSRNYKGSFEAARVFYRKVRGAHDDRPTPVAFIEVLHGVVPLIEEPEILDNTPHVAYYGIAEKDVNLLKSIIRFVVGHILTIS